MFFKKGVKGFIEKTEKVRILSPFSKVTDEKEFAGQPIE